MRKNIIPLLFITAILGILVSSCSDFLDPKPDNRFTLDDVIANPGLAEGWLLKAYKNLPSNYNFNEDFASDDAVTNDQGSNIISMNNGGWNASNNPIGIWGQGL